MNKLVLLCAFLAAGVAAAEQPNVLIIGDSISLGYTPHVAEMMKGEAVVTHNKGNAQHTGTGVQKIDTWLGETKWDVIHFNWGLWDLCYRHPESKNQGRRDKVNGTLTTSLDDYESNLEKLVVRLKQTGAILIWGNITVVPEGEAGRKVDDDLKYNEIAARVMKKHGVRINDLNAVSRAIPAELLTKPGDVHFKPEGYSRLATGVVDVVRTAIRQKADAPTVSRILFGSCIKQDLPVPIFDAILTQKPELFIFLGDNIYGDTEDMNVLQAKYEKLGANAGFQKLRQSCPILATWDDHDFGVNDGGADYPRRDESEQVFLDFWLGEDDAESRHRPGVYDARIYGPADRRIQVIMLDTRYFRSPLKAGEKRVGGSWQPDDDPSKTMLGEAQWKWLEEQLLLPAELRIIASSIQFIAEDAGQETWSNLPSERRRMVELLSKTKAGGVIFISGDRHWSELSALDKDVPYPLLDLTSSSLNQLHARGTPTENRFRALPKTCHVENFGVIDVDWKAADPVVLLQIMDIGGGVAFEHAVVLKDLSGK